jgi:hypothetical protein
MEGEYPDDPAILEGSAEMLHGIGCVQPAIESVDRIGGRR